MERYPEKRLQLEAIQWLRTHWHYEEHYSDEEARGNRMGSVGLIDGRLTLIEVKNSVSASLVAECPFQKEVSDFSGL